MARNRVYVEINPETKLPIRILKHFEFKLPQERFGEWPRKDATESIRRQVFERAKNLCDKCGKILTWGTMHLHERTPRSKGGEVSVENGWALCYQCHILEEHGTKRPQWQKTLKNW